MILERRRKTPCRKTAMFEYKISLIVTYNCLRTEPTT